jgi:hypothetical protein
MSGLSHRSSSKRTDVDFVMDQAAPEGVVLGRLQGLDAASFVVLERPDVRAQNIACRPV